MGRPKGSKNRPKDPEAIRAMAESRPRAPKGAETVAARPKELDFGDEELPKEAEPKGELVPMAEGLEVVKAELVPEENKKLARRGFRYTPEELKAKVDDFLAKCEKKGSPPLLTQMLLYLGISRATLKRWAETDPEYAEVCEYAQLHREAYLLERMVSDNKLAQGSLNALKQPENGGYVDRPVDNGESKVTINLIGVGGAAAAK